MTLVQSEPKAIKIGIPKSDYSAMQGPCDAGFHIPLQSEWQTIYNIGVDLGIWSSSNGDGMKTYLKIPFSGQRNRLTSDAGQQGSRGFYWFSDNSSGSSKCMNIASLEIQITDNQYTGLGRTVRPIKDTPVTPDSSWTALYSDKIYHNSTLGLISISSDGTNWITIADKNVGATSTDTSSSDSYGYYFQRGNCYGFPTTGSVSTSSSTVNAGSYGPGNYYSSSTFVTVNGAWDNSNNYNLRGGETGAVLSADTDIKAVYLGTTAVRPAYKPRTFTITRTEKSDMSSGWTYSDDAAGLTAGSTAFDEFFGYYGCRLNENGEETAQITQAQSGGNGKLDITQLGTLTSGDNVMICFPKRGIKMTKSGTTVTLSITNEENKSGYQYYAFNDNGVQKDKLYIGTYKISYSSSKPWSLSGKSLWNSSLASYCSNINSGYSSHRYHLETLYTRWYIAALYMMKYGNPYSQGVIGNGYISSYTTTSGKTNSITNATGNTVSSGTTGHIKLFGLEDWWGNGAELLDGAYASSNTNLKVSTSQAFSTTSYISTFDTDLTVARFWMYNILGNNAGMFAASTTGSSSSDASKYYRSSFSPYKSSYLRDGGPSSVDTTNVLSIDNMGLNDAYSSFAGRMIYL